jgi:phage baseplate assembly protein W
MDQGKLLGKGIAFPPRIAADGSVARSEGEANVRESIQIILLTERGERTMLHDFGGGLQRLLFEANTASTRQLLRDSILKALGRWEPRVAVESVEVEADPADSTGAIATIVYKLVATQARERVSLSIPLRG